MENVTYDPRSRGGVNGANTAAWTALAFGALFGLLFSLYAVSDTDEQLAANDRAVQQTLPSTTGQGDRPTP